MKLNDLIVIVYWQWLRVLAETQDDISGRISVVGGVLPSPATATADFQEHLNENKIMNI